MMDAAQVLAAAEALLRQRGLLPDTAAAENESIVAATLPHTGGSTSADLQRARW